MFSSESGESAQRRQGRLKKSARRRLAYIEIFTEKNPLSFLEVPPHNINANMYKVEFNKREPNECERQSAIRRNKKGSDSVPLKELWLDSV